MMCVCRINNKYYITLHYIGDGFYGSNDPTNSVKALKKVVVLRTRLQSHPVRLTNHHVTILHMHAIYSQTQNNTCTKMNLSTVKWAQWDKTQSRELLGLFKCACSSLCTIVAHNTAQNRPDNFPSCPPDNRHCSDEWYLFEGKGMRYKLDSMEQSVNSHAVWNENASLCATMDIIWRPCGVSVLLVPRLCKCQDLITYWQVRVP